MFVLSKKNEPQQKVWDNFAKYEKFFHGLFTLKNEEEEDHLNNCSKTSEMILKNKMFAPWILGTTIINSKIKTKEFPFEYETATNEKIKLHSKTLLGSGMYKFISNKIFRRTGDEVILKQFGNGYKDIADFQAHVTHWFETYTRRWIIKKPISEKLLSDTKTAANLVKKGCYLLKTGENRGHNDVEDKHIRNIQNNLNKNTDTFLTKTKVF